MRNIVQIRSISSFTSKEDLIERELTLDESTGNIYLRLGDKLFTYYQSKGIESFITKYFDPQIVWRDTSLGIKLTSNQPIKFTELKGDKGDKGDDIYTSIDSYIKGNNIPLESFLKSALDIWESKYSESIASINQMSNELSKAFGGISVKTLSNGLQLLDSNKDVILEIRDGKIYADGFIVNRRVR